MALIEFVLVACLASIVLYLYCLWRSGENPIDFRAIVDCGYSGPLVVIGIHLIYCAFVPDALTHLVKADGGEAHVADVFVKIGDLHRIDLGVAGAITVVFGAYNIFSRCREVLG